MQRVVAAFDDNGDGGLSLLEYRLTPKAMQLHNWNWARGDGNNDAKLSFAEFFNPSAGKSPAFAVGLAYEHFRRWDRNHDNSLTPDEFEFNYARPRVPLDEFTDLDLDKSGDLTPRKPETHSKATRDFNVVDFNHNDRLSWDEMRSLPGRPFGVRGPVPDPIQLAADRQMDEWKSLLARHDRNKDGCLDAKEWPRVARVALRKWG